MKWNVKPLIRRGRREAIKALNPRREFSFKTISTLTGCLRWVLNGLDGPLPWFTLVHFTLNRVNKEQDFTLELLVI